MKFHSRFSLLPLSGGLILLALGYQLRHAQAATIKAINDALPAKAALTSIHDIQGSGTLSPFAGQTVMTSGIVTAVRSNGFFLQAAENVADGNPDTSEAIFVFTGTAAPAAARGNRVNVTGLVTEFRPAADPVSPPMTEFSNNPAVELVSTGNALPAPVALQASDTQSDGALEQLERFEAMRVTIPSFTVVAPTGGTVNEANATTTTNGLFFGVVTSVARPYREPGIEVPDALPPGAPGAPNKLKPESTAKKLKMKRQSMKSTFPTSGLFTHQVKRLLGTIASPFRVTCEKPKIDGVARAPYRAVT